MRLFHQTFLRGLPAALAFALLGLSGCGLFNDEDDAYLYPEQEQGALSVQTGVVRHVRELFSVNQKNRQRESARNSAQDPENLEITIGLDNGQETIVVQPVDDFFKKGDRVRLLTDKSGLIRVQHE
jgi:outer membrane lipoprotein SlyB